VGAVALATLAAVKSTNLIADDSMMEEVTVIGARTIFANNAVTASIINQQTPIKNPLSLIDNLPSISIQEHDTYGFDDRSTTISMHGFPVSFFDQQNGWVSGSPLIPQDRFNAMLVYAREDDLRIGLAAYCVTSQELHDGKESRDYWIFGLMMEKVFSDELLLFQILNFVGYTSNALRSSYRFTCQP
jgi:hypothetical protein